MEDMRYANSNIKLLLNFKEWTQADLCKKTGITPITMRRRLNGKTPKWTMLEAISVSNAFGKSVHEVFFTHMIPSGNKDSQDQVPATSHAPANV